jgi:hypothetical protein
MTAQFGSLINVGGSRELFQVVCGVSAGITGYTRSLAGTSNKTVFGGYTLEQVGTNGVPYLTIVFLDPGAVLTAGWLKQLSYLATARNGIDASFNKSGGKSTWLWPTTAQALGNGQVVDFELRL